MDKKLCAEAIKQAQINKMLTAAASSGIQLQYIRHTESALGIIEGDTIFIDWQEGPEKVIYEGARSTGWVVWIVIRHFTKKGRLCKNTSRYDYDICDSFKISY